MDFDNGRKELLSVLGAGLITVSIAAAAVQLSGMNLRPYIYLIDIVPMLLSLAGIYFIINTFLGGELGRGYQVIGLGLLYYILVTHQIHLPYHTVGNPHLLGLHPAFWTGFVHVSSIAAFVFTGYGFYLLYRVGDTG